MTDIDLVHTLRAPRPNHTVQERDNLDLIRRFRAAPVTERRTFMTPDFVRHRAGAATLHTLGAYSPDGIPDRQDEIVAMIAKDDVVWAVWRVLGTHRGELFGVAATGRPIDVFEVGIWRIQDGLVAEAWFLADELAWAQQMGLALTGEPRSS